LIAPCDASSTPRQKSAAEIVRPCVGDVSTDTRSRTGSADRAMPISAGAASKVRRSIDRAIAPSPILMPPQSGIPIGLAIGTQGGWCATATCSPALL
jgi:hypothetical protein